MIYLITNTSKIYNDMADMIRLFYGTAQVKPGSEADTSDGEIIITHNQHVSDTAYLETYTVSENNISTNFTYDYPYVQTDNSIANKRTAKRSAKLGLYYALKSIIKKHLPWGALTGIRPVGLYRRLNMYENNSAHQQFSTILDVSKSKLNLVEEIITNQKTIYYKGNSRDIDVYIGVPFCPTRCLYCSFISHDLSQKSAPIDEYVECVLKEADMLKNIVTKHGKRIRCLYFGGGTPTTLGHKHLDTILTKLSPLIDSNCEITVEAGRVDAIDENIFKVLKSHNVGRISINPQTLNDDTLRLVNRNHTAKEFFDTLDTAVKYNFKSINTDLIMGLPGETKEQMEHTLSIVTSLPIDNLTIHTLAIKRASKIRMDNYNLEYAPAEAVAEMVDKGREAATQMGMAPYYLYRQKYMSGNLENVGYAKKDKQCVYNIDIMEETHNLVALGAGGISKRFFYGEIRHTRFANPKSVAHYINNIDAIIAEKQEYFKGF